MKANQVKLDVFSRIARSAVMVVDPNQTRKKNYNYINIHLKTIYIYTYIHTYIHIKKKSNTTKPFARREGLPCIGKVRKLPLMAKQTKNNSNKQKNPFQGNEL